MSYFPWSEWRRRLDQLVAERPSVAEIAATISKESGRPVTPAAVESHLGRRKIKLRTYFPWPQYQRRLDQLAAEGLSASKIAAALHKETGREISRNAVIGRLHRVTP